MWHFQRQQNGVYFERKIQWCMRTVQDRLHCACQRTITAPDGVGLGVNLRDGLENEAAAIHKITRLQGRIRHPLMGVSCASKNIFNSQRRLNIPHKTMWLRL